MTTIAQPHDVTCRCPQCTMPSGMGVDLYRPAQIRALGVAVLVPLPHPRTVVEQRDELVSRVARLCGPATFVYGDNESGAAAEWAFMSRDDADRRCRMMFSFEADGTSGWARFRYEHGQVVEWTDGQMDTFDVDAMAAWWNEHARTVVAEPPDRDTPVDWAASVAALRALPAAALEPADEPDDEEGRTSTADPWSDYDGEARGL